MPVLLLEPRSATFRDIDARQPPPGSILVAALAEHELDDIASGLRAAALSPWCPLVLASRTPPSHGTLDVLRLRATRLCAIELVASEVVPSATRVRQAVVRRRVVTAGEFCAYLGARAGADVGDLTSIVLVDRRSDAASLRRWARRLGELSPRQWISLFNLAVALSHSLHHDLSQERCALELNVAPRSLGAWCTRFLGLDWRESVALCSWEAACEIALRRHRVVRDSQRGLARRASGAFVAVQLEEESCA